MPIQYALLPNNLTDDPRDYMAKVYPVDTVDLDFVIDEMKDRGTTVGEADIRAVLTDYRDVITDLVAKGYWVTTSLVTFSTSVRGHFQGSKDLYNPGRHRLMVRAKVTKRLQHTVRQRARLTKKGAKSLQPLLIEYRDYASGTRDSTLTCGGLGRILGRRLKFDPDDPEQGIFFVATDKSRTRVAHGAKNTPRELIFIVPDLPAGPYDVAVRAKVRGSAGVREGWLPRTLTVP